MKLTNIAKVFLGLGLSVFLLSGCYTQIGAVKSEAEYEEEFPYYESEEPEDQQEYATEEENGDETSGSDNYYYYYDDGYYGDGYYPSPHYRMYFRYYSPSAYYGSAFYDPFFDPYWDCYWYYDPWLCGTSLIHYPWLGYYPWYYGHRSFFALQFGYFHPGYYYSYPGYGYRYRYAVSGVRNRTNRDFGSTRGDGGSRARSRRGYSSDGNTFDAPPAVRSLPPSRLTGPNAGVSSDGRSRKRVRETVRTDREQIVSVRERKQTRDSRRTKKIRRSGVSTRVRYTLPASERKDSKGLTERKRLADSGKSSKHRQVTERKKKHSKSSPNVQRGKRSSKKYATARKRGSSRSSYSKPAGGSRRSFAPSRGGGARSRGTSSTTRGSSRGSRSSGGSRGR